MSKNAETLSYSSAVSGYHSSKSWDIWFFFYYHFFFLYMESCWKDEKEDLGMGEKCNVIICVISHVGWEMDIGALINVLGLVEPTTWLSSNISWFVSEATWLKYCPFAGKISRLKSDYCKVNAKWKPWIRLGDWYFRLGPDYQPGPAIDSVLNTMT